MTDLKSFVRPDNTATVNCPACKVVKQISVEAYRYKNHSLTIRCKCNAKFTIDLDFRTHYRKKTNLPGTYRVIDSHSTGGGDIQIYNISQGGIGFTVSDLQEMKKGLTVQLEFRLNDKNQTKLVKQARICSIENNYIGCQFIDQNPIEKALGFYLRP